MGGFHGRSRGKEKGVCLEKEGNQEGGNLFGEKENHKSAVSWNSDLRRLKLGGGSSDQRQTLQKERRGIGL